MLSERVRWVHLNDGEGDSKSIMKCQPLSWVFGVYNLAEEDVALVLMIVGELLRHWHCDHLPKAIRQQIISKTELRGPEIDDAWLREIESSWVCWVYKA